MKWILHKTGKWHAWPKGGRRSKCGTLTLDDLRVLPARRIVQVLPNGAVVCGTCGRMVGKVASTTAGRMKLGGSASAWLGHLRKHLMRVRVQIRDSTLRDLARRLGEVGPPEDPQAIATYDQIRVLLLTPQRHLKRDGHTIQKITRLKEALALLPKDDPQKLHHVAETMRLWRRITGRTVGAREKFRADTVVASMLEVPTPEPYIKHLHSMGLSNLALMFHPNTIERRKSDAAVRGVFSGSSDYMQHTAAQLDAQIITDEEGK